MIRKTPLFIRISISLITLFIITVRSGAQVFPVVVNTQLAPPYSPYLSDYTAPGQQKFMVQVRPNDANLGDYNVKFRITIEGVGITIKTKQNFIPQPTTIPGGGVPLILYGEDLHEYFNPNNLDFLGLSRKDFAKTGKLPEGVYRFYVEVLDYNRGTVVSNKGTTTAWIILNDPPLLNLPGKDTKIRIVDPTNIPFTWTPRHTGSPNSAFSTEYIFRLVEIWPANRNPYDAFLTQPVLYEAITDQSQIVYGMSEPALIPGRKYAWQVQARDVDGKDLFKNNGKSEVHVFQFGDALGLPENLRKEGGSDATISLRWEPSMNGEMPDQYRVRFTPKFNDNWYESITTNRWITLSDLQPNTEYQVQVRAEKSKLFSEYTTVQRVSTDDKKTTASYNCGQPPNIPIPAGSSSLFALNPGDIFSSADFKVVVTEVTSAQNGMFTGKGMMAVNLMNGASIDVTFAGSINNKYELTTGSVISTYERGSEMAQVVDQMHKIGEKKKPDQNNNGIVKPDITITGTIDSIYVNSEGKIVVINDDGTISSFEQKKDEQTGKVKETIITDATGNTYTVAPDGKVTKGSPSSPIASSGNVKNYPVVFKPSTDQQYGFDKLIYDAHINNYKKETINGGEALVVWKSVASGRTDNVIAWTDKIPNLFDVVTYESPAGDLAKKKKDDGVEITVIGGGDEEVIEIAALQPDPAKEGKKIVVGRVNVISYDPIIKNLVLVSVNGAAVPSTASLTTELNKIFGPSIVSWNINPTKTLKADLGSDGKLDDGTSGLLSNYTQEMRDVIREFKKNNDLADETYYLFFVGDGETLPRKDGYMPRKKQCGFIFTNGLRQETLAKTIAHELAHGAFRLEHTFETYPSLAKGTTDNLMDYSTGTRLHKYQWDLVHNPVAVWGLFEGDEEGAYSWSGTLVDKQHTELFDYVYEKNHIGKLTYLTEIERLLATASDQQTLDLDYSEDEQYKEWVNSWKIRVVNSETVLNNTIKVIQSAKKGEKLGKIYLRPNHIYIAKYNYNNRDYPIAIYNAGKSEVMENVFTKVEITKMNQLKEEENKKRIYIEETFYSYFVISFYEEQGNTPTLIIQVEKFPFSDLMHNSMEEWMKFLRVLVEENDSKEKVDDIFLSDVEWVSQFDSRFTDYTCYPEEACCYQASLTTLSGKGVTTDRSQQVVIAKSSSSDCSSLSSTDNFQAGINMIDKSLSVHKLPILVGVHHPKKNKSTQEWYHSCSGNTPSLTNHYVVIVGSGYDESKKKKYYRFYEVGTSHQEKGTSTENRLYIDPSTKLIIGNTKYVDYQDGYFTITEVRKNIGQTY